MAEARAELSALDAALASPAQFDGRLLFNNQSICALRVAPAVAAIAKSTGTLSLLPLKNLLTWGVLDGVIYEELKKLADF